MVQSERRPLIEIRYANASSVERIILDRIASLARRQDALRRDLPSNGNTNRVANI